MDNKFNKGRIIPIKNGFIGYFVTKTKQVIIVFAKTITELFTTANERA